MNRGKINWLLILQGWAMLWVVVGHSFLGTVNEGPLWENALVKFAYSFHMPLFMFVSGWLFYLTRLKSRELANGGGWNYNQIVKDKALRLLLPGLVFSIFAFVTKAVFPSEVARSAGLSLGEVFHSYLYPIENPLMELWFIVTLFWFFVIFPLWEVSLRNDKKMWLMVVLLIVLHFCHPNVQFLCLERVFKYAIWFYLGIVICKTGTIERVFNKVPWLTFFVGIVIYVLGYYTDSFITKIGGITLSIGFALLADKYVPRLFFSFRNYTYQIFLMGIFAQVAIKILYRHITMPYVVGFLICFAAGLYIPVLVSRLVKQTKWKPLLMCIGLKTN